MNEEVWWWSIIVVILVSLGAVMVIDANRQNKQFADCKQARIRAFPQEFFTWEGMLKLNNAGLYQPKCL